MMERTACFLEKKTGGLKKKRHTGQGKEDRIK